MQQQHFVHIILNIFRSISVWLPFPRINSYTTDIYSLRPRAPSSLTLFAGGSRDHSQNERGECFTRSTCRRREARSICRSLASESRGRSISSGARKKFVKYDGGGLKILCRFHDNVRIDHTQHVLSSAARVFCDMLSLFLCKMLIICQMYVHPRSRILQACVEREVGTFR